MTINTPHLNHDIQRCAYIQAGQIGCTRCLTVCPNQAITIVDKQIHINLQQCNETGNCITACPHDAFISTTLSLHSQFAAIQQALNHFYEQYHEVAVLVLHDAHLSECIKNLAIPVVSIDIAQLSSFSVEMWLACLAIGAKKVLFLYQSDAPVETINTLKTQWEYACAILTAMGYSATVLQLLSYQAITDIKIILNRQIVDISSKVTLKPVLNKVTVTYKRDLLHFALERLLQSTRHQTITVELPADAPFGQILLNKQACTLCFSCVTVCPTHAFSTGQQQPQLYFSEYLCIQCQLCVSACPEKALQLQPRFAFDAHLKQTTQLLYEEPSFHCISCGKAFATQTMINRVMEKLKNHSMFQGEALKRLQMCEVCRVKALIQNP